MNAILLAAGYGKRLSPITKKTPKCLVKIGQRRLLGIWINKLISLGVKRILLTPIIYQNKLILSINQNIKKIKIFYEKKLLGTAQTVFRNRKFLDKNDSLIIHADNFCVDNLKISSVSPQKTKKVLYDNDDFFMLRTKIIRNSRD